MSTASRANRAIEDELHPEQQTTSNCTEWPEPPRPESFYGLAGDVVRILEPHSEADPVALLTTSLIAFGSITDRHAYFIAEADHHYSNLNMVQVGATSKARKGSSFGQIRRLYQEVDLAWVGSRIQSGLSSGEGLIWAVHDAIEKSVPVKENGKIARYEMEVVDPGVKDKRLLVVESEFSSALRVMRREGSTLSAIIRMAWDSGNLRVLTKNSPAQATNAHISILGHITQEELLRYLDDTEAGNGFANRFLWVCVRRSKILPEGGALTHAMTATLIDRLNEAVTFARSVNEMHRDDDASKIWHAIYEQLSEGKPGLVGAVTARAEAQVMRLACVYALMDMSPVIRREHLLAALALWDYCESSVRYIFGEALGDPIADTILRALQTTPDGLNRTRISDLFGRHQSAGRIAQALAQLETIGRVRRTAEESGGRPTEKWFAK